MTLKPSAQGSLAKTPFPHLLLHTHGRALSGTLAIWPDREQDPSLGQDRLLFQGGSIVAVRPMAPATQAHAVLLGLFRRRDAAYAFYENQNLLGSSPSVLTERVDTYNLLARGLREVPREDVMDAVLGKLGSRPLRIRAGVPLDRLEFGPKERAFIDTLRAGPASVDELISTAELDTRDAKRVLYILTLIRGIETAEGGASLPAPRMESGAAPKGPELTTGSHRVDPSQGTGARRVEAPPAGRALGGPSMPAPRAANVSSTPAPSSLRPAVPTRPLNLPAADSERWNELTRLYERIDDLNHFQLLQVAPTASASDVNTAYYALVKKFHPDRLPTSLTLLTPMAQLVFERITEANETLSNAQARGEYDKAVAAGGGTRASERMMRNVLESALEFQKSEVLTKRRDFTQALQLIRSAISKTPEEADYLAHHAWLLHLTNPAEGAPTQEMLDLLDRAIKLNPRNERAHYYKGVVLKRLNRNSDAVRHFRTAAEINPRNVDAVREVRLSHMRKDSKPPPAASGSGRILSKLFGGGKNEE
jgi:curved DNA-binding protein CbpA